MMINWIIALLALSYYWLKKYTKTTAIEDSKLEVFINKYLDDIALSVLAVIILGLLVINKEVIESIGSIINAGKLGVSLLGKLLSLTIGLLNCWVIDKLMRFTRKKINNKLK